MKSRYLLLIILCVSHQLSFAQQKENPPVQIIYKKIDTTSLKLEILYPSNPVANKRYPCIVFFFGGGWLSGNINQFRSQAMYLTKRGMTCFLVEYRIKSKHNTTPFECLKDAKSAVRFIRKNAKDFHIHPDSIVASGGSGGGHLAAATATIDGYNEASDDLTVSAKPNALVLFNPVIDNGPGGYGFERIGKEYKNFSPLHNIHAGAPPTLFFLGTKDNLIPVETAQYFKTVMQKVGSRCELVLYEGEVHGFFNKQEYVEPTMSKVDAFLTSLHFLP
jgi:acetyl esterase/lipase